MTFVIVWIICAFIGMGIGKGKGKRGAGFALGLFLGPIGIVIIALMKENTAGVEAMAISSGESRKCPYCAELVKRAIREAEHYAAGNRSQKLLNFDDAKAALNAVTDIGARDDGQEALAL